MTRWQNRKEKKNVLSLLFPVYLPPFHIAISTPRSVAGRLLKRLNLKLRLGDKKMPINRTRQKMPTKLLPSPAPIINGLLQTAISEQNCEAKMDAYNQ